jgi:arylsulfatase A-like enzyme
MFVNRLAAAACLFAAVCIVAPLARAAEPTTRPNIVLVISDDQRWDAMGVAGNSSIHTPNMDRLAKEGIYFRQATIHVPQCGPSRATLLTGLAPHQHGWFSNQAGASNRADLKVLASMPTVPGLLKDAGYRTVLVGKWHLQVNPWDAGFTDVRTWLPAGMSVYSDASLAHGDSRKREPQKGFINQIFGDDAAAFINSPEAKEKPFLLWVALTAPHGPYQPNPPEIAKRYADKSKADLVPPGFPKDKADNAPWNVYYEACTMADRQLGTVLDALDKRDLASNTVVIFLGDNGYMMGGRNVDEWKKQDKPFIGKVFPFEESVRVPMIVRFGATAGASGKVTEAAASSLDLPPTILKAAHVEPPKSWVGRNLNPQMRNGQFVDYPNVTDAVCEFADNESDKFGDIAYRLVRTPKYKLIVWQEDRRKDALYDVAADPMEQKNLIDDPAMAKTRDELMSKLKDWCKRTNDPALQWPHFK